MQQYRTVLHNHGDAIIRETGGGQLMTDNVHSWKIGGEYIDTMNILGLVFFSGINKFESTIKY